MIRSAIATFFVFQLLVELATAEPVKIGIIAPLTVSNIDRGQEIAHTVNAFSHQLREKELKHQYSFVVEDGKCGVGGAATAAAEKLLNIDQTKFLIAACSGETIQAAGLTQPKHRLLIGVLASDPAVRDLGNYVYRTYVDIEPAVTAIAKRIVADGHKRVAVLTEEVSFTQKIGSLLNYQLRDKVVLNESFAPGTSDFRSSLTKLRASDVDALYLNGASPATMIPLVNQTRALGLKQPIYTYFMPAEKAFRDGVKQNSEGIVYIDVPDVESKSGEYNVFVSRYEQLYPEAQTIEFLRRSTFDALELLVSGIEAEGPSPEKVKNYLDRTEYQGALGRVRFDKNGDIEGLNFVLRRIVHGRPEVLPES